jgi:hypothetical protein
MRNDVWQLRTQEQVDAYEADPRTIEWRKQEKRAAANARAHCTCGRFVKVTGFTYFGDGLKADCSLCGPVVL